MYILIISTALVCNVTHCNNKLPRNYKNVHWSSCKVLIILVRLQLNLNFLNRFSQNTHIANFMKIRLVGAELFHAGEQKEGQTNMTKRCICIYVYNTTKNS